MINLGRWVPTQKEDMQNMYWYVLVPSYRYLVKMGAEDDDHDLNTDSIATLSCAVTCSLRGSKECQSDNVVIVGN